MATKKAVKKQSENTAVEQPKETREQKFQRLAPKRVNIALHRIRLIGNLSTCRPTDAQVDKICAALGEACVRLEARLRGTRKDSDTFAL